MSVRKKASFPTLIIGGVASAAALTLILLMPCALLMYKQLVPESMGDLLAACAAGAAVLISVIIFARSSKTAPQTGGLILLAYLLVAILAGFCICGRETWSDGLVRQSLAAVAGGAIGIMVSIRKKPRRKRRSGR